jgi:four helix bundle protein
MANMKNEDEKRIYDLEDRLVAFACLCLEVCDLLPNSKAGLILQYQISKSATSAALNYGEAQAAESPADFLHKLKVVLKEIRESRVNLKIIKTKPIVKHEKVDKAYNESCELMAIFITSVETSKKNNGLKPKRKN